MISKEVIVFGYANDRLWLTDQDGMVCVCVGHSWASLPIAEGNKAEYVSTHTQEEVIERILSVLQKQSDPIVRGYLERTLYASARYSVCIKTSGTINITVNADGEGDAKDRAMCMVKAEKLPKNLIQQMEVMYTKRLDG